MPPPLESIYSLNDDPQKAPGTSSNSTTPDPTGWEGASGFGTVVPRLLQW
jgi:hypothetical protein